MQINKQRLMKSGGSGGSSPQEKSAGSCGAGPPQENPSKNIAKCLKDIKMMLLLSNVRYLTLFQHLSELFTKFQPMLEFVKYKIQCTQYIYTYLMNASTFCNAGYLSMMVVSKVEFS